jgi:hypothetical protein
MWFEPPGRPVPAGPRALQIIDYLQQSAARAGLPEASYRADGSAVTVEAIGSRN